MYRVLKYKEQADKHARGALLSYYVWDEPNHAFKGGIPEFTKWFNEMNREASSHNTVLQAQRTLTSNGYDPGTPDGIMGPRTRSAIRKFQRDTGLPMSGRLDRRTLATLE